MKQLILILTLTLATLTISAQGVNLVPLDSAQYEIINGTLVDRFEGFPKNRNITAEVRKNHPNEIDSLEALVSYKSGSSKLLLNEFLIIYKKGTLNI